jgi:hypothetical protein
MGGDADVPRVQGGSVIDRDTSKPLMYLINLFRVMQFYKTAVMDENRTAAATQTGADLSELSGFAGEDISLHGLVRVMLRLDNLSFILGWTYEIGSQSEASLDVIELPRMRLRFEKRVSPGVVRYYCHDYSGYYLSYPKTKELAYLMAGLPQVAIVCSCEVVSYSFFGMFRQFCSRMTMISTAS